MSDDAAYVPFSQRNGLAPIPERLNVGQISKELRRLLQYYLSIELERVRVSGYDVAFFGSDWQRLTQDLHVLLFGKRAGTYENNWYQISRFYERFIAEVELASLFDFVEFIVRHKNCSNSLVEEFSEAFIRARAAYRIIDKQIVVIGSDHQGRAFEAALHDVSAVGAEASRKHLVSGALALRNGDWAASIREHPCS